MTDESPWLCPDCRTWNGWRLDRCLGCDREPPRIPVRVDDVATDRSFEVSTKDRVRVKLRKLLPA